MGYTKYNKSNSNLLWKKVIHIKSCCIPKYKTHITRYQLLQHFKQDRKGVLHEYSEKIKASISSLHNNSSSYIESTIRRSSKSITSLNGTNISEMSNFSSASNITTEIDSINSSNVLLVFGIDGNYQKSITSNKTCLTISVSDIIITEVLAFNLYQDQDSIRKWICQVMFPRLIFLLPESLYPKN